MQDLVAEAAAGRLDTVFGREKALNPKPKPVGMEAASRVSAIFGFRV